MLKRKLSYIIIVTFSLVGVAQLVRPDLTNPRVEGAMTIDGNEQIPANVKAILKNSCADCHTDETRYPWYSQITPVNWWLKSHIDDGRRHLNLSTGRGDVGEICREVSRDKMPLPSYLWAHWGAKLSLEDKKTLCEWSSTASTESK